MAERPVDDVGAAQAEKRTIRLRAKRNCEVLDDKDELSRRIHQRLTARSEYGDAKTILTYVATASEVATEPLVTMSWDLGKRVVVPLCHGNELELFEITGWDDLAPRTLGILEPRMEIRQRADRRVTIDQVDLVVVPGVAFDKRGGRIGHGRGYYDRLLARAGTGTVLAALAFQCQLFAKVPMLSRDVFMDLVITETAVYPS